MTDAAGAMDPRSEAVSGAGPAARADERASPHPERSAHALRRRIARYYAESQFFYEYFWTDRVTRSMNYGFSVDGTEGRSEAFQRQNEAIAEGLGLSAGDVVLEAGCGTGGTTVCLAAEHGVRGVGVTLCPRQAERARRFGARRSVGDRVSFFVMDYLRLAFADGTFTKAFASESACYAAPKSAFAQEMHRVLRPGGRLLVVDGFLAPRELGAAERGLLEEWSDGWGGLNLTTLDQLAAQLTAAGFRNVTLSEITDRIMPSARRIFLRGLLAYPLFWCLRRLGLVTEVQWRHVRSSIAQYRVFRDRIAVYGVVSADRVPS